MRIKVPSNSRSLLTDCAVIPLFEMGVSFAVLFVADLSYRLLETYVFDTDGTDVSYYVADSLCFLVERQLTSLYEIWGVPLLVLQVWLLYRLARNARHLPSSLAPLACSQVLLAFLCDVIDARASHFCMSFRWPCISSFICAQFFISSLWAGSWWFTRQSSRQRLTEETRCAEGKFFTAIRIRSAISATFTVLYSITASAWIYTEWWLPNLQLNTPAWNSGAPLSQNEIKKARDVCHKVLRNKYGNHHCAFVLLSSVGNVESIPYVIDALKLQRPPDADNSMVDTTFLCLALLESSTGEHFGFDYHRWKDWWDREGSKMSAKQLTENAIAARKQLDEMRQKQLKRPNDGH